MPTLISGSTGVNKITDGTITNADIASGAAIAGTKLVMPTGSIVSYKFVTVSPGSGGTSTSSTSYVEGNSGLRITHAMAASGNKLIFSFYTIDTYITSSTTTHIAVTNLTDVTTNIMSPDRPLIYIKSNNGLEPHSVFGHQEYSPGSTSSITYCVSMKTGGSGTAYMNNTPAAGQMRFTLTEIVV